MLIPLRAEIALSDACIDDEAVVDAALPVHTYENLGLKPDDRVFIKLRSTRFFDEVSRSEGTGTPRPLLAVVAPVAIAV